MTDSYDVWTAEHGGHYIYITDPMMEVTIQLAGIEELDELINKLQNVRMELLNGE